MSPRVLQFELAAMSIRTYFKPKDGLPNPKGPLSQLIPSQAIALANIEVAKATGDKRKKRGLYFLINVVASNTAGPFKLFHDELLRAIAVGPRLAVV